MASKIFFGNYKGGVGKTTSTYLIGNILSQKENSNVLLIDLDPQSSLSEICTRKCYKNTKTIDLYNDEETLNYVYDMYIEKHKSKLNLEIEFNLDNFIKEMKSTTDAKSKFDFIPSSLFYREDLGLDQLNMKMSSDIEYLAILKRFIGAIEKERDYDYILIDCPPSSNIITQGAFLMSDYYVIPTILDGLSTNGVLHYIESINQTYDKYCTDKGCNNFLFNRHFFGKRPILLGVFYTLQRGQVNYYDAKKGFEDALKNKTSIQKYITINGIIFENYTNNYIDIARTIVHGGHSTQHPEDYEKITDELVRRLQKA